MGEARVPRILLIKEHIMLPSVCLLFISREQQQQEARTKGLQCSLVNALTKNK